MSLRLYQSKLGGASDSPPPPPPPTSLSLSLPLSSLSLSAALSLSRICSHITSTGVLHEYIISKSVSTRIQTRDDGPPGGGGISGNIFSRVYTVAVLTAICMVRMPAGARTPPARVRATASAVATAIIIIPETGHTSYPKCMLGCSASFHAATCFIPVAACCRIIRHRAHPSCISLKPLYIAAKEAAIYSLLPVNRHRQCSAC